jgi:hypothetical protein
MILPRESIYLDARNQSSSPDANRFQFTGGDKFVCGSKRKIGENGKLFEAYENLLVKHGNFSSMDAHKTCVVCRFRLLSRSSVGRTKHFAPQLLLRALTIGAARYL